MFQGYNMHTVFVGFSLMLCISCCSGFIVNGLPNEHTSSSSSQLPVVQTVCGSVRGRFNGKAYSFKGIPYALPPTGERRWEMPVPLSVGHCWKGEYHATEFKNQCVQVSSLNIGDIEGSEDCLYLNVWTPTLNRSANLPVFVFIHGGNLQSMNGSTRTYSPSEELANETNVVYVSMNYRLQAFGFLALSLLSEHSSTNTSGNYGFMDQITALKWVKANIENFGGNPNLVTIAGQSSGGTSVFALLASPFARGLFNRAWIVSGSPILKKKSKIAEIDNLIFLIRSGCHDIYCLKNMTAKQVINSVPLHEYPCWGMDEQTTLPIKGEFYGALAVVDGYVIPEPPFDAWVNGNAIDVPLLISTTAQEVDTSPVPSALQTRTGYEDYVHEHLDTFSPSISKMALKLYPPDSVSQKYQFTSMVSDIRENCPNDILALYASMNTASPVYRYVLTAGPSHPVDPLGAIGLSSSYAFHTWDLFAFFGSIKDYIKNPTAKDVALESNMRREILSFVHNGKPFTQTWNPFPEHTALMDANITVVNGYHPQRCQFWLQNGFFDYAWIN